MYNPAFQDVNNQPNKLDLEKHWLKYILVHIHQQLPMDYLEIKMAVKKYRNCFFLSKKEQGIIEVRRNLMHFFADFEVKSNHHITNKVYWAYF